MSVSIEQVSFHLTTGQSATLDYLRGLTREINELEAAQAYGREHPYAGYCGEDDAADDRLHELRDERATQWSYIVSEARHRHEVFLSFFDRHPDGSGCEGQLQGLFEDAVRAAAYREAARSVIDARETNIHHDEI